MSNILCNDWDNVRRWIQSVYMDTLNIDIIKDNEIKTAVTNINRFKSHMRRFEKWALIYTKVMVPHINEMSCTIVQINKMNIAYLYSSFNPIRKQMDIMLVCTGVNMVSADGEYRGRLIRSDNLRQIIVRLPEICDDIETYIQVRNYDVNCINFVAPVQAKYTDTLNTEVSKTLTTVICAVWFCEQYLIYFKLQNTHKNPKFNSSLFTPDDQIFFTQLFEKYGYSRIVRLYQWFTVTVPIPMDTHIKNTPTVGKYTDIMSVSAECGQKLIPLRVDDIENPMNPTRRVWREIIIWKHVSSLALNLITPGVPIFNLWFLLPNNNAELFNNNCMNEKFADSLPQKTSNGKMSNSCLVILCESTGSTINNTLMFHQSPDYVKNNKDLFKKSTYFMKYLFDIAYTLYCMNAKCGVIHADLHRNNTTMNSLYFPYFDYGHPDLNVSPAVTDNVIYHIGDEIYYAFPHIIKIGTVIDFSRSIILDKHIDKYMNKETRDVFHNNQELHIINWYRVYFPDLYNEY